MKYMVMVNGKYMTQVEVDGSACAAEHVVLDDLRYGVESALAFDAKAMKTDYFGFCFQSCELVALETLKRMSAQVKAEVESKVADVEFEYNEIAAQIEVLKAKQRDIGYEINHLRNQTGKAI